MPKRNVVTVWEEPETDTLYLKYNGIFYPFDGSANEKNLVERVSRVGIEAYRGSASYWENPDDPRPTFTGRKYYF